MNLFSWLICKERLRWGFLVEDNQLSLHSFPAGMKCGRTHGELPVTNDISGRLLRLPLYYEMSDEEVKRVVDAVTAFHVRNDARLKDCDSSIQGFLRCNAATER